MVPFLGSISDSKTLIGSIWALFCEYYNLIPLQKSKCYTVKMILLLYYSQINLLDSNLFIVSIISLYNTNKINRQPKINKIFFIFIGTSQ